MSDLSPFSLDVYTSYAEWLCWCNSPAASSLQVEIDVTEIETSTAYVLLFDQVSHDTSLVYKDDLIWNSEVAK